MKKLIVIFIVLVLSGCNSRQISSTIICEHTVYNMGTVWKNIYTLEIDSSNKKVYIQDTAINPHYSEQENRDLEYAEMYSLMQEQYDIDNWVRDYKNINGNLVWREKYGTWTLNRGNFMLTMEGDGINNKSFTQINCYKSEI